MNLLNAIYKRKSRRSYTDAPIEKDKLAILKSLVEKYNQESGLTMKLIEDGSDVFNGLRKSYGMFSNVQTILVLKGKKEDKDLKEKCGYFGEYIVLEAVSLGLGSCWVGATFDKASPLLDVKPDEERVCVITLGNIYEKTSLKENIIRKMAHGKNKPLEHFYVADTTPPAWFMEGIQSIQVAPSAVNKQDYHFEYTNGEVTAVTENSVNSDIVDLGIAKAHFVIAVGGSFTWGNHGKYSR